MEIDYRSMSFWFGVLQWAFQLLALVWVYLRTKDTDNQQAIADVRKELTSLAATIRKDLAALTTTTGQVNETQNMRLATLEEKVAHMPTDAEIAHLTGEVSTVKAQVNSVAALLQRVEHQTQLIHEHLLSAKR